MADWGMCMVDWGGWVVSVLHGGGLHWTGVWCTRVSCTGGLVHWALALALALGLRFTVWVPPPPLQARHGTCYATLITVFHSTSFLCDLLVLDPTKPKQIQLLLTPKPQGSHPPRAATRASL